MNKCLSASLSFFHRICKGVCNRMYRLYDCTVPLSPYRVGYFPVGINFIGFFRGNLGLGEGVRALATAAERGHIPHVNLDAQILSVSRQKNTDFIDRLSDCCTYAVNVIHVNPSECSLLRRKLGRKMFNGHYNIGFWLWELETLPSTWENELQYCDELWAPSEFICKMMRKATNKPVNLIPYGIELETSNLFGREYFNLKENDFICLCMFDISSYAERKNPYAAIDAFRQAFSEKMDTVKMVIKINSPNSHIVNALREYTNYSDNYIFMTQYMERHELDSLIHCADVFISLHRSEGFGMVIAEAMYLGTVPVVTNWSANTEFAKPDNSCTVDYRMIPVEDNYLFPNSPDNWADPDISQAAKYLEQLYSEPIYRVQLAQNGAQFIRTNYSMEKCAENMRCRLDEILDSSNAVYNKEITK